MCDRLRSRAIATAAAGHGSGAIHDRPRV
ncbi:MAG: hypothetical protein JWM85_2611, partial [Acidimicrobiaceae bacterium]|nr:hypothetical protein [Acidimicrobiaceae bacterium]